MNKNFWNLCKDSQCGKAAISLWTFNEEQDDIEEKSTEIFKKTFLNLLSE